ncbi:hypothetical protein NUW54_g8630 [Trametes sanguinea]|uniref:Uncharacterized protein n=1 Tax=Trametes sanguinea TaxID=158606 RepID=A0ACC1PDQ8_9APHY|nr:hypothetical protein NUW54_g8630 [Trametes sanguinea]
MIHKLLRAADMYTTVFKDDLLDLARGRHYREKIWLPWSSKDEMDMLECDYHTSVARKRPDFVGNADLVQELYLRELKSYKPPPQPQDAHVGVVKNFQQPPAPQAPALPADLASELSAYDAAEPTFAASAKSAESEESSGPTGAEAFLSFLEADEPKAEAHH